MSMFQELTILELVKQYMIITAEFTLSTHSIALPRRNLDYTPELARSPSK